MLLQSVISDLAKNKESRIGGLWGSASLYLVAKLYQTTKKDILIITEDEESDFGLDDLSVFLSINSKPPTLFLAPSTENDAGPQAIQDKILFLNSLITQTPKITIVPKTTLLAAFPDRKQLDGSLIVLKASQSIERNEFIEKLLANGYEKTLDAVHSVGEISIRGGIIDIFPFGSQEPVRIEWDANLIESIRFFDMTTQLSIKTMEHVDLYLTQGLITPADKKELPLLNYFPPDTVIVFIDRPVDDNKEIFNRRIQKYPKLFLYKIPIASAEGVNLNIESIQRFGSGFTNILRELGNLASQIKNIYIVSQNKAEESHLKELLTSNSFPYSNKIRFLQGRLNEGFYDKDEDIAFISHRELFNRYRLLRQPKAVAPSRARTTEAFWELQRGDFAVHLAHGIGRYLGLKRLYNSEYLSLEYQDKSLIYVPITQIGLVSKYWAGERRAIKVDKIGTANWLTRRERVKNAIKKLAQELLYIQALRIKHPGFAYPLDNDWQKEFENSFPYEETPDQTAITQALKDDMESARPMDRLICGDVGYGKTELAIRTAFKVCMSEKQVAVIAPTTILAQQHYRTFSERMADYPVNIEVISRFRSEAEQRDILKRLAEGKIDIIIGTHRLIQGDVKFKDLGLVVIDEEQRFGVEHKEYFKKIKASVDVLTLSATPIPRTLHLSLSGLREISTMTTPPKDRQSIRTIVARFDNNTIKDAIHRELQRKGQIYFVHNRIYDIENVANRLKKVCPEVKDRIVIAHGQMPGAELEQKMRDFVDGKYDILVSTNIIESGLDIPRVNTIFINNADDFGLSDLHQLRGRVGRYKYQAYAYFLVTEHNIINTDAAKRLKAIEEFNELGAGFKIAMRDMEIRGIGNILGKEQHGHIAAVGYELYCKLIEQAVKQLKGRKSTTAAQSQIPDISKAIATAAPEHRNDYASETIIPAMDVNPEIETYIPAEYVTLETERLNIYRRLSLAESAREISAIERELKDRFGRPLPDSARNLFEFMRHQARQNENP
ncbi:MAG: transcription-repair coupling factor [Planctomycetes bacterium]|nr:transcription-repair coupling factor [Planctomycetota bacterium]